MFTGAIYFKLTPNGYVVTDFNELPNRPMEINAYRWIKELRIFGTFNFTPVKGQFCKRPHKLIQWSK